MTFLDFIVGVVKTITTHGLGIGLVLAYCTRNRFEKVRFQAEFICRYGFLIGVIFWVITALLYLLYPNFVDHIEPSLVNVSLRVIQGFEIYPPLDDQSFAGLLYGPLASLVFIPSLLIFGDPILGAKLSSVAIFLSVLCILTFSIKSVPARAFLVLLFPFGFHLFWARPEPFILFGCALALLVGNKMNSDLKFFMIGIIGGFCFLLKVHAVFYIAPFFFIACAYGKTHLNAQIKAFALYFLGHVVVLAFVVVGFWAEFVGYLSYLSLASAHGISLNLLIRNVGYSTILAIPSYLILKTVKRGSQGSTALISTLLCSLIVGVLGSKPGSGLHHLMPMIVSYAYLIQKFYDDSDQIPKYDKVLKRAMVVVMVYVIAIDSPKMYLKDDWISQYPKQVAARNELLQIKQIYPNTLVGSSASDPLTYSFSFYRVWFAAAGVSQTDPGAFMDWSLSGIKDDPVRLAFERCAWHYILVPRGAESFSLKNFYTGDFLYAHQTRDSFQKNYQKLETFDYYNLYKCFSQPQVK